MDSLMVLECKTSEFYGTVLADKKNKWTHCQRMNYSQHSPTNGPFWVVFLYFNDKSFLNIILKPNLDI